MRKTLALLCLAAALIFCSKSNAAELTGTVTTDGSTSMEKVIGSLGEAFSNENSKVRFAYNPTGSGAGIAAVKEGRCDIGLSSRNLKPEEKAAGLESKEVALDGIAIIIHPDNPVKNLSVADIAGIYNGSIKNWEELGGRNAQIVPIGREAGSGTREGFETVAGVKDKCRYRQELSSTGDVIATVSRNPAAIGYASLGAVKKDVRTVSVDGIQPSETTVKNGSYKLQRPFLLVTKKDATLSPVARAFYDFSMSPKAAPIITKAGAVAPR